MLFILSHFCGELDEPVGLYQSAKNLFNELDKNKDGVISSAEIRLQYPSISEEEIREIFDTFDLHFKGVLTFEEIYHLVEYNTQSNPNPEEKVQ